jgi:hypothetical protein
VTTIRIYDPATAGAVPSELPPLPIGALAVGVAELLQQAADLPSPRYISISDTQHVGVQFGNDRSGLKAVTRWAARFGGVVTSKPGQDQDGNRQTWFNTEFDYYGIEVRAYAHIPAATGRHP